MANVLTNLGPDAYRAADMVVRELTGFIPSVMVNAGSEGAAINQNIRSHFTRAASVVDISPSMTIPEGTDQTVDTKTLTMTKERGVQIPWTGEDVKFVDTGAGWRTVYGDQILQAMRAIANEIETDVATEAYQNASRAFGTAGSTPFASNFDEIAEVRQILADNGIPVGDQRISLVLNTAAGTNLRQLAQLQKANEGGGDQLLRQGELLNLQGFSVKESAQVQSHTQGTASSATTDNAGYAVGATVITLASAGTGTIVAGDVITFAGDTNQYVVVSGDSDVSDGGTITLAEPGLRVAIGTSTTAITVEADYTANVGLHQDALEVAIRPPASPMGGDAAVDVMNITDPRTGITFELSAYKGFKKAMFLVGAVWGFKAWKEEGIAILQG